jgi:exonuclease SbcD
MAKYQPNIVAFGDAQLGTYRYPVREYICAALTQIMGFVRKEKPDLVLFCGDAFRTRTPTARDLSVFGYVIGEMAKVSPIALITGNHDIAGHGTSTLDVYDSYQNVDVIRYPQHISFGGFDLIFFPWLPSKALSSHGLDREDLRGSTETLVQLVKKKLDPDTLNIMVGHCTALGATWGDEVNTIMGRDVLWSSDWFKGFDIVFLGHLHKPQWVPGADNVLYTGSLCPVSFNELDHEKSFVHYHDGMVDRIYIEGPVFTQVESKHITRSNPDDFMGAFVQVIREHGEADPTEIIPDCLWYEIVVRPPKRDVRQRLDPEEAQLMNAQEAIRAYLEEEGESQHTIDEVLELADKLAGGTNGDSN